MARRTTYRTRKRKRIKGGKPRVPEEEEEVTPLNPFNVWLEKQKEDKFTELNTLRRRHIFQWSRENPNSKEYYPGYPADPVSVIPSRSHNTKDDGGGPESPGAATTSWPPRDEEQTLPSPATEEELMKLNAPMGLLGVEEVSEIESRFTDAAQAAQVLEKEAGNNVVVEALRKGLKAGQWQLDIRRRRKRSKAVQSYIDNYPLLSLFDRQPYPTDSEFILRQIGRTDSEQPDTWKDVNFPALSNALQYVTSSFFEKYPGVQTRQREKALTHIDTVKRYKTRFNVSDWFKRSFGDQFSRKYVRERAIMRFKMDSKEGLPKARLMARKLYDKYFSKERQLDDNERLCVLVLKSFIFGARLREGRNRGGGGSKPGRTNRRKYSKKRKTNRRKYSKKRNSKKTRQRRR